MITKELKEKSLVEEHFVDNDEDDILLDNKYLTFSISKEIYGININDITEIIEMQKITGVPDLPLYVKGIINLRGKVIPIIDLRLRFSMEERVYDDRTCIVIVDVKGNSIGFIVDTVLEVVNIPEKEIEPAPQFKKADSHEKYIMGIGKVGDNVKILLDSEKIVCEEDIEKITEQSE